MIIYQALQTCIDEPVDHQLRRPVDEMVQKLRENGIERVVHLGSVAQDLDGSSLEDRLAEELKAAGIEFVLLEGVGEPAEFRGIAADRGREN